MHFKCLLGMNLRIPIAFRCDIFTNLSSMDIDSQINITKRSTSYFSNQTILVTFVPIYSKLGLSRTFR